MRRVINFHVADHTLAEDIYQDFFLSLVDKPVPPNVYNMKGYLYQSLTHDILDSIRRVKHYQARIMRYAKMIHDDDSKNNPESSLIKSEETDKMFKTIEKYLSSREAKAVKLRLRYGLKTREVAQHMGISPRSVSRYLSVGMKKIRATIIFQQKQS